MRFPFTRFQNPSFSSRGRPILCIFGGYLKISVFWFPFPVCRLHCWTRESDRRFLVWCAICVAAWCISQPLHSCRFLTYSEHPRPMLNVFPGPPSPPRAKGVAWPIWFNTLGPGGWGGAGPTRKCRLAMNQTMCYFFGFGILKPQTFHFCWFSRRKPPIFLTPLKLVTFACPVVFAVLRFWKKFRGLRAPL